MNDTFTLIFELNALGYRVAFDQKRASGEWRAEVWVYNHSWFLRGSATSNSLYFALKMAVQRAKSKAGHNWESDGRESLRLQKELNAR